MKQLTSLSVFFPAFNEAANLPHLLEQANQVVPQLAQEFEYIVVNDGSTDNTIAIVDDLKKQFPNVCIVSHPKNEGYGAALKTGIAAAQYDWIFFTDADLQFDLHDLHSFIPYTEEYNAIIGYRKNRADGSHRKLNAKLFKLYIDLLFRVHVTDIDCAFKLLKRTVVQPIRLESSGAFTTSELLYKLKKQHVRFKELPVSHYPRKYGNPTGANLSVIIKACYEALDLYTHIKLHTWFKRT